MTCVETTRMSDFIASVSALFPEHSCNSSELGRPVNLFSNVVAESLDD